MWRLPRRARRPLLLGALCAVSLGAAVMLDSTDYLDNLGASAAGDRLARMQRSAWYQGGKFVNREPVRFAKPGEFFKVAGEWWEHRGHTRPPRPLPSLPATRATFAAPPHDDVRLTWLGHSTVLVELEGHRLLTDPMWSERSSPSRLAGPQRFQPVPLPLAEVPLLDAVVISHDHYDHLDKATVVALAAQQPEVPFLVPLGVGAHLERWGIATARIVELDVGQEHSPTAGLRLVATPARHFSGRRVLDRDRTLWLSWAMLGARHRVFFGGDGGYQQAFGEIGTTYGPFDVALLEIGAWHEAWGTIHLGPANALQAQDDLRATRLLPIHWGTFNLAVHAWDEPIEALLALATATPARLLLPRLGEPVLSASTQLPLPWWRAAP